MTAFVLYNFPTETHRDQQHRDADDDEEEDLSRDGLKATPSVETESLPQQISELQKAFSSLQQITSEKEAQIVCLQQLQQQQLLQQQQQQEQHQQQLQLLQQQLQLHQHLQQQHQQQTAQQQQLKLNMLNCWM